MKILMAIAMAFALSGCAALESIEPDTKQLAVQYATMKVIDGEIDKRDRVLELVEKGRRYVQSDAAVTIAALDTGARDLIRWDSMDPADQILVDSILLQARERLENEIGTGLLNQDQKTKVVTVLDWIERAASGR